MYRFIVKENLEKMLTDWEIFHPCVIYYVRRKVLLKSKRMK